MISDIWTVMWKERKGLFRQQGSRTRAVLTLLVPVLMFAILLPWQEGVEWSDGPLPLITSVFIPLLLVGTMIPESFAGERERHTLGTLLASRLPDRAILFGKMAVAVGYAWGVTLLTLVISLVTINIAHWDGQVILCTPAVALVNVAVSLLMATIMAGLGVLISLRASTVQGATQILMAATLMPFLVLGVVVTAVLKMKPEWFESIREALATVEQTQVMLIVGAVLVMVCLGLLMAAMARFQRARLVLD